MPDRLDWRAVIHREFPPMSVDQRVIEATREAAETGRYAPVDARIALGKAYTDESYRAMRAAELARPLP